MEVIVLNEDFEVVAFTDTFESFIWTDRYDRCGDFELYLPVDTGVLSDVRIGYYISINDSDRTMIVENVEIKSDVENGNYVTITGRSLESILDRRIIWTQTVIDGKLQDGIKKLLTENAINPTDSARKIPNLVFKESTDSYILEQKISAQFTGDNLYEVICEICSAYFIGFKITLNQSNELVFELYNGADRSYNQTDHPYIIFSSDFENVINSNYIESIQYFKNVALIAGEGEGKDRKTASIGEETGMSRRELFVDAREISSDTSSGTLSKADYEKLLIEKGNTELSDYQYTRAFEGEMDTTMTFKYGTDFFIGDVVQVVDSYGNEAVSRVTELVRSFDENGYTTYPTLSSPELV